MEDPIVNGHPKAPLDPPPPPGDLTPHARAPPPPAPPPSAHAPLTKCRWQVVVVTGAAGQIAYSLVHMICDGAVFGPERRVLLRLLDIPPMAGRVEGLLMELADCGFPLLHAAENCATPDEAFADADVAVLVGAFPRRQGMERSDLLAKNGAIFKVQGAAIDRAAKKSVKVLVVGNPANTNALIASKFAPSIAPSQFTALTFLDQNRAQSMLASRAGLRADQVRNVIIWGNHSATQYPDVSHAAVVSADGARVPLEEVITDTAFLEGEFIRAVQTRGQAVIKARQLSSALSAAKAICDHLRTWCSGTAPGELVSMGVMSDGSYGVPEGIVYSFPVSVADGRIRIERGLPISDFSRAFMERTADELVGERELAFEMVGLEP